MQWDNITGQYLSALDENMNLIWINENIIFPSFGMVNVGSSVLISGDSGVFQFNGETGKEEKLYQIPNSFSMALIYGYPLPLFESGSTYSLYSWSWKNTLQRFSTSPYWNWITATP